MEPWTVNEGSMANRLWGYLGFRVAADRWPNTDEHVMVRLFIIAAPI